jgi:cobalt/nickel transport system permease protein
LLEETMFMGIGVGLFAVHLADGLVPSPLRLGGWLLLGLLLLFAWREFTDEQIPRVGLLTAALFVASQIHVPLGPGSVHLLLTGVAGILLGRLAAVAIAIAVTFQAVLFAHGGLTTIGLNAVVLALPAVLLGLVWPRVAKPTAVWGAIAGFLPCFCSVLLNGLIVWLALPDSTVTAAAVVGFHIPVLIVETLGTAVIVAYLAKVKPEWLRFRTQSPPVERGTNSPQEWGTR